MKTFKIYFLTLPRSNILPNKIHKIPRKRQKVVYWVPFFVSDSKKVSLQIIKKETLSKVSTWVGKKEHYRGLCLKWSFPQNPFLHYANTIKWK